MHDKAVEDEDSKGGEADELAELEALQQQNQNTNLKKKPGGRKRKRGTPPTTNNKAPKG